MNDIYIGCKVDPPNQDQWIAIVEQIYIMEKMTFHMRLQEAQGEQKMGEMDYIHELKQR